MLLLQLLGCIIYKHFLTVPFERVSLLSKDWRNEIQCKACEERLTGSVCPEVRTSNHPENQSRKNAKLEYMKNDVMFAFTGRRMVSCICERFMSIN